MNRILNLQLKFSGKGLSIYTWLSLLPKELRHQAYYNMYSFGRPGIGTYITQRLNSAMASAFNWGQCPKDVRWSPIHEALVNKNPHRYKELCDIESRRIKGDLYA